VLLAILGGYLYSELQPGIHSFILRGGAVLTSAIAVGLLGLIPVRYGRVHSVMIAAWISAALSIVSQYAIWLSWLHHALFHRLALSMSYSLLIWHPTTTMQLIKLINRIGTWSTQGEIVHGPILWGLWLAEAGVIVAIGVLIPIRGVTTDDPDCRECGSLCRRVPNLPRFAVDRQNEFVASVEARDFTAIATHARARHEDDPELSLRLMSCPQCKSTHVLTVNRIAWQFSPKTGRKVVVVPLVNQLLITSDEAEQIQTICKQIQARREVEKSTVPQQAS
jgi:hypothetical protein